MSEPIVITTGDSAPDAMAFAAGVATATAAQAAEIAQAAAADAELALDVAQADAAGEMNWRASIEERLAAVEQTSAVAVVTAETALEVVEETGPAAGDGGIAPPPLIEATVIEPIGDGDQADEPATPTRRSKPRPHPWWGTR